MRRRRFRYVTLFIVACAGVWALMPPSEEPAALAASESVTSSAPTVSSGKIVIKVAPKPFLFPGGIPMGVGKPVQGLKLVEQRYEALNPDVDIQYIQVPMAREWLVSQVASGLAPDIVDVNVEEVWGDTQKGWYIPLDSWLEKPNSYAKPGDPGSKQWWDSLKYPGISRGVAAPDGLTYCIVFDMVETAIYYNKNILGRLGLSPPANWTEFLSMQQKLRAAGHIPMLANSDNLADWAVDLIFDQYYQGILPGIDLRLEEPPRSLYLVGYLDGDEITFLHKKGFFTRNDKRYLSIWHTLKEWRQHMSPDINTQSTDFAKLFLNQKGAMLWDGSWRVHQLNNDPSLDFDWGLFYLPPITSDYNEFADGHPQVVIGGPATQWVLTNTSISDTHSSATSKRLEKCIDFLQFLTTPESSAAVSNEVAIFLPNVTGVEPRPELLEFDKILQRRYSSTKWFFTFDMKFNEILLRMLELYLNNGISESEFLDWMERNIVSGSETLSRRKKFNFTDLERRWEELAPVRATMKGLPDAPE